MADKKQKPAFTHMRWSEADDKLLRELIERGADVVEFLIEQGLELTQGKFNS